MRLYFFRHGDATYEAATDAARELTDKGRTRTRQAAEVLKGAGLTPDRLYCSPRVRAKQTAAILAEVFDIPARQTPKLDFEFDVTDVDALTRDLQDEAEVIFVGHNPSFEEVISMLVGGGEIAMKKSGVARVDVLDREMLACQLIWLIAPKVFEALMPNA